MVAEGFIFPRGFASKFNVARSIGQNIPSGAWTVVQWDTELFDLLDEMLIVNPWTFTPKQAGYYLLAVHARLNDLTVPSIFSLYFYLNGIANIAGVFGETTNVNEDISLSVCGMHFLTPNDAVDIRVWHNNGIVRALQGNVQETRLIGLRVA